jgi:AraC family transcriptional regulator, transcriptional activator of pobA
MDKIESIEGFYKRKFGWLPDNIKNEIGHFNVFPLEPFVGDKAQPVPYKRRDFYKIMLLKGHSKRYYADKEIEIKKQGLVFSNPRIPYSFEHLEDVKGGVFCIFNEHFLGSSGIANFNDYSVFQLKGVHVFESSEEQMNAVSDIYKKMFEEIASDYVHKYDVLRGLVLELIHFALKMNPSESVGNLKQSGYQRIATLFLELLERQFPIDESHPNVQFRSASEFANQLNVHVNHLNRAVKEISEKTTSQIIGERLLQESKIMLKHSDWNISEIAYSLGFKEVTHFNNFFKKQLGISPSKYRKS